jgi:NADPH-dependent curcumin reductase CurA
LVSRVRRWPTLSDFELVSNELPALRAGQVLVRNVFMSVDPYMRSRLGEASSRMPAFRLGEPLEGSAVGEVVASAVPGFAPGDAVTSMYGWREYFIAGPDSVRRVDRRIQPLSAYLGVLGSTGLTAWVGMNIAAARPDETVFVSAAAGAVGSVTGQLARLQGCRVSGGTGSSDSVHMLVDELGFDAAFDDGRLDLREQLEAAAPDGVDVYFDNTGGYRLDVVLAAMRPRGRIVTYGATPELGAPLLENAQSRQLFASKHLVMKAFLVSDWLGLAPVFQKVVGDYLMAGQLRASETIVNGIERAPEALMALLRDDSAGKILVQLA